MIGLAGRGMVLALGLAEAACSLGHPVDRVTERRPAIGRIPLAVRAELPAGEVVVGAGAARDWFDLTLTYCRAHYRSAVHFAEEGEPAGRPGMALLEIGTPERGGAGSPSRVSREPNRLDLRLRPGREFELNLAADGRTDLDLTALAVRSLSVHAGSGPARVRFAGGNPREMELLRFTAGAGEVQLEGLGWGRVSGLQFHGGSGPARIDWSGPGPVESAAWLDLGTGPATLVFPTDLSVEISGRGNATPPGEGFTKIGGAWVSANTPTAGRRLTLVVDRGILPPVIQWKTVGREGLN